ncbi:Crp/Fnr family transcriptional regulator [Variovorax sp. H27-G14]|uniref:Crp/Fnr family transcriptional regulator n=1 Tax=Variovorax sp. H27-G14 TaxID=3111914 RepID=UPI0038FD281B
MSHDGALARSMQTKSVLLNRTTSLSDAERGRLEAAIASVRTFRAGETAVRQDTQVQVSLLLVEGFMTRHVDALDGKRHLVAVHVPGDFVDLHAFTLKQLDHDVGALTDVSVAVFTHDALEKILIDDAALARRLWFITMLDAAQHRQWIYRLSSLTALQRVAHFFCETHARLLAVGRSRGHGFSLPMTQSDIGEVCSLTNVHVNRVLRDLREMGLCQVRSSQVQILDLAGLVKAGLFEPGYLYLNAHVAAQAVGHIGESHDG